MSKLLIAFSFIITSCSVYAQWMQIATIGSNELRGVKFLTQHTGIIVGQGGIWRSSNSGVNWTQVLNSSSCNDLSFIDSINGYVVADSGKIFRTYDSGLNWTQQGIGMTTNNLYGAEFSTSVRFNAVGANGIILRTGNGGVNWTTQGSGADLYSIIMNTNGDGFAIGSNGSEVVRSTINGGTNWLTILNSGGNSCYDGSFTTSSSNIVCVGNNGRIRKSTNSGLNWYFPNSGVANQLNGVAISSVNGYIAGNNGIILKTTNAGENWTMEVTNTSTNLNDISSYNQLSWAVGSNGVVLRTGLPVGISNNSEITLRKFNLYQNYPNPFNPSTNITFNINNTGNVQLKIFDVTGREVMTLKDEILSPGFYSIELSSQSLATGIYFCEMNLQEQSQTIKIINLK